MNLVFSASSSSTICHQRAFSLPQNPNLNVTNNQNTPPLSTAVSNVNTNIGTLFAIQPVHQRTRSLPLTEETAVDFSQSPPNFMPFENSTNSKFNNNSMESIIEDQNVNMSSSGVSRLNNSSNSILKHLSKLANSSNASSPAQLRKKRQHHNFMTASLRSTYQMSNHNCCNLQN